MTRSLWLIGAVASLACMGLASTARAASSACPVAGHYWLVGRVPGSTGSYRGEARISERNGGCFMKWSPPNNSEGTGEFVNGVLTIRFHFTKTSGSGVVQYVRRTDGSLNGTWWMDGREWNQGPEVLSSAGPPQLADIAPPPPAYAAAPAASPSTADWTYLDTDSHGLSVYYRLLGASPANSAYQRIRLRSEYSSPQQASGLSFSSAMSVADIDCSTRMHRYVEMVVFERPNMGGNSTNIGADPNWEANGNRSERWTNVACR